MLTNGLSKHSLKSAVCAILKMHPNLIRVNKHKRDTSKCDISINSIVSNYESYDHTHFPAIKRNTSKKVNLLMEYILYLLQNKIISINKQDLQKLSTCIKEKKKLKSSTL